MEKIVNPITKKTTNGRSYRVFVKIKFDDGRLSITGVEGPLRSGNCLGSCGQIANELERGISKYMPGWDAKKLNKFVQIWRKWHLNDMHAECIHQEERGENWAKNPGAVCPQCGWKLGYGWSSREVPQDVIEWLFALPEAGKAPAWV